MAVSRGRSRRRAPSSSGSPTAQQDEADIVASVGAERDEESGELLVDEAKILELGAIDASTVIENERLQNIVNRKKAGEKKVIFNADDLLTEYETLIKVYPVNTFDISVKRLTGSALEHVITSRPRTGAELYNTLMAIHGQFEEAKYAIKFFDTTGKQFRGNSQITLPDTRPQQVQGQPMTAPPYQYPPPVYNPQTGQWYTPQPGQPGYTQAPQQPPPQQGAPPQAQPQQPDPQQQPPPQPPAQVFVPPPPPGPDPMAMMQQMWEMFQKMQPQGAPQQPPQQQPPPMPPPPPPAHADQAAMMQWVQQVFGMFQQMQPQPAQQAPGAQPQPQANPMAAMMGGMMGAPQPPMDPPPGTIWLPPFGFVSLERMAQVFGGAPGAGGPHRSPYSGGGGPPAPYTPPTPPAPPKSAAEQFQEAVSVVQTAVDAVKQVNALLPQQPMGAPTAEAIAAAQDDDSPVQIIDTGPAKLVVDRKDGTLRTWETGWANMKGIMDWVAEQREAIQRGNAGQQDEEEEPKQLPPGYVVVKEGYEPPPGMVAVPVDPSQVPQAQPPQQQAPLPPPPANTPPPLQSTPPPKRTWEMPTVPIEGEG